MSTLNGPLVRLLLTIAHILPYIYIYLYIYMVVSLNKGTPI